jgi:hypothetical protein
VSKDAVYFFFGQDDGQASGFLCVQGVDGSQVLFQYLAVEEQQGAEGLTSAGSVQRVLGGGSDISLHGQVGEKGLHFQCAHLGRMAHVMEVDVAFDPVEVGLLGADGVVSQADGVANTFDKLSAGLVE